MLPGSHFLTVQLLELESFHYEKASPSESGQRNQKKAKTVKAIISD